MSPSPRPHFVDAILPSFKTFADHYTNRVLGLRTDLRLAAAVAGSLRDFSEHAADGVDAQKAITAILRSRSKAFAIASDFADAWKHRKLDRKARVIDSLDDVAECVAMIRHHDSDGIYYVSRKLLEARLRDGSMADLGRALQHAVHTVGEYLVEQTIIPLNPKLPDLLPAIPQRGDSRFEGELTVLGARAETFHGLTLRSFVCRDGFDLEQPTRTDPFGTFDLPIKFVISESPFGPDDAGR